MTLGRPAGAPAYRMFLARERRGPSRGSNSPRGGARRVPLPGGPSYSGCRCDNGLVNVTLPDGTELELADGATGADAAATIGAGLARAAIAVRQNGEVRDLARPLVAGVPLEIITPYSDGALDVIRHDAAHVLAAAVMELYPGVKISIGPAIENGFYYDFEFPEGVTISDADFDRIEQRMRQHINADEHFVREDVTVAEALERFRGEGQDYKVELIEDLVAAADPRASARDGQPVHERSLHRPLPRPTRARHEAHQGGQAAVRRRRVLARRLQAPDADAHLRHGVFDQGRAQGAPRASRAGEGARSSHAWARSSACSCSPRSPPAARSGCPPGRRCSTSSSAEPRDGHRRAATPRSRRRSSTTRSCGRRPATGASTASTCS